MADLNGMGFFETIKFGFKIYRYKNDQRKSTTGQKVDVQTKNGTVRGVKRVSQWSDEFFSFEGIPFGKPPIGELRFRAPQPAEPWTTVLDCTGPAEKPLQPALLFKKFMGSEDCLYLNVFTTNLNPTAPRPVMVWIYGGGFQSGEATRDLYSPEFFMSKDVVFVALAYRLGALGFLSLNDPAVSVPGNAGIKDQILGLRWVHENIAAFGGDPGNVTLFGESAGGAATQFCMISEKSRNLIHKAIVMSGSALAGWAHPPKNHWGYRLAIKMGYRGENNDIEVFTFLKNSKGADIVKATESVLNKEEKHDRILFAFTPVVEPYVTEQCIISEDPYEVLKKSWSNDIPLMIGATSLEGLLFYQEVTRTTTTLDDVKDCQHFLPIDLNLKSNALVDEYGLKLKSTYFGADADENKQKKMMAFFEIMSDREMWHPIYRTVLTRQQYSTAPTYVYRFDYDSKEGNAIRILLCGREVRGVCHGDDLVYLFNSMILNHFSKKSPEERVKRTMIDIWTSFAAKSNPNCDSINDVKFEPVTKNDDVKCLNISSKSEFVVLPELERMKLWSSFYVKPEELNENHENL